MSFDISIHHALNVCLQRYQLVRRTPVRALHDQEVSHMGAPELNSAVAAQEVPRGSVM